MARAACRCPQTSPGRLAVTGGSKEVTDEVSFSVVAPDQQAPTVQILAPLPASHYDTSTGEVELALWALATDSSGQPLPGTRLRWVARNGDQDQLLCAGTQTPSSDGGLTIAQSCADVTATLEVPAGASSWSITVEAYASPELTSSAQRGITVTYTPPPMRC